MESLDSTSSRRDSEALRGEAVAEFADHVCAAIKAADNKSVDEAGYMLDSNDCISIIREIAKATSAAAPAEPVAWTTPEELRNIKRGFGGSLWATPMMHAEGEVALYASGPSSEARCEYCDGTGDVYSPEGEWRGCCECQERIRASTSAPITPAAAPREEDFETWWERSGQFSRAGGGGYEKTFAFNAWHAALASNPTSSGASPSSEAEELEPRRLHWTEPDWGTSETIDAREDERETDQMNRQCTPTRLAIASASAS